jgi:tetrahydromethanopterin S-methyltransferase subunit C
MLLRIVSRSETRFSMIYRGGHEGSMVVLGNSRGVNAIYAPEVQKRTGVPTIGYNGLSMEAVEVLCAITSSIMESPVWLYWK